MKTFYDQWWESVSVQFDQEINIPVGNEAENPVTLTTHDWHADNGGACLESNRYPSRKRR